MNVMRCNTCQADSLPAAITTFLLRLVFAGRWGVV